MGNKGGRKVYRNKTFSKMYGALFDKYPQKKLSEMLGVSVPTLNSWKQGGSFPDVASLIKISDLLGVSVDYLLGLSECNSLNGDIQSATRVTGLSTESVERLVNIACEFDDEDEKESFAEMRMDIINGIIESDKFKDMLDSIYNAEGINIQVLIEKDNHPVPKYEIGKGVMLSGYDARAFFIQEAQKTFGSILEDLCIHPYENVELYKTVEELEE